MGFPQWCWFALTGVFLISLAAQEFPPATEPQLPKTEMVEQIGQAVPLYLRFADEQGDSVSLGELLDKPTVVSIIYYNCPAICTPLLSGVIDTFNELDLKAGEDYKAITLSFNQWETPDLAMRKKNNYFRSIEMPFPDDQWHWLTGTGRNITAFTEAVGFQFSPIAGGDFEHPAGLIVLSKDGRVVRYLHGIFFSPFDLKMAIIEASEGYATSLSSMLLNFSFDYDSQKRGYILNFGKLLLTFVIVFTLFFVLILRRRFS